MFAELALAMVLFAADGEASDAKQYQWVTYYYLQPNPTLALDQLEPMNEEYQRVKGASLAEASERGGLRSFYAEVFKSSPEAVALIEKRLPELPVDVRVFVNEALRRCDTSECARVRGTPYTFTPEPLSVSALDDHWAAFIATGDTAHVAAVIEALPLMEVRGDIDRLMIGGAARWSLGSNAYQHSRVLQFCKESLRSADEPTKKLLTELIQQAEEELAKEASPEPKTAEPRQ